MRPAGDFPAPSALLAFYDLAYWPITYDIFWFLVAAELARRDGAWDHIHVVFVSTDDWASGKESKEYFRIIDGPARQQRLSDILLPSIALLPSARGVTITTSRAEASVLVNANPGRCFPSRYSPELPQLSRWFAKDVIDASAQGRAIPPVQAPEAARAWVERWCRGAGEIRPIVTITLRYFDYLPVRNSNILAWAAFARELDADGFCPVVVPDTHMTLDPLPAELHGLTILAEAAWNLHFRMALYEAAFLNLTINTGPAVICMLSSRCRYIAFKMQVPGEKAADLEYQRSIGIDVRRPFPFATPFQKLVLEADDLPVIRREFEAMRRLIEADAVPAAVPLP